MVDNWPGMERGQCDGADGYVCVKSNYESVDLRLHGCQDEWCGWFFNFLLGGFQCDFGG